MTQAQQLMEVKRKASNGIALTDQTNKANQAVWNTTNTNLNNEINRKADNNIALADPNNAYVKKLYDARVTANSTKEGSTTTDPTTTNDQPTGTGTNTGFDLQSIYDNMYSSQAQKLKSARDQALAGLVGQEDVIAQNRISALNNNDITASQQLKALREANANAGVNGGDSVTGQIANQTAQGQNASGIEQNAGNQLKQLLAQRDQINNSANAEDLALLQGIQSQQGLAQQSQYNTDRGYGLDLAQLSGRLPGGGQTLAGQQFDYSKQTDQRNFDYGKTRDAVSDSQWSKTFELDKAQYGEQFAYQQARDKIADAQDKRNFDEQVRQNGVSAAVSWYNAKTSRASENRLSSGGSGGGNSSPDYSYKTDPKYAQEVALSATDPARLYSDMVGNAQEYIDAYGLDGYTNLWNRVKNQAPKK